MVAGSKSRTYKGFGLKVVEVRVLGCKVLGVEVEVARTRSLWPQHSGFSLLQQIDGLRFRI